VRTRCRKEEGTEKNGGAACGLLVGAWRGRFTVEVSARVYDTVGMANRKGL
jgi:hypothetical protein